MAAEGYDLVAERTTMLAFGSNCHGPGARGDLPVAGIAAPDPPHDSGRRAIREYVELSRARQAGVIDRIAQIAASGERIYVWGTGTHTLHLLETSRLRDCRIEAFLDSNPHYAGATLIGRPVLAPGDARRSGRADPGVVRREPDGIADAARQAVRCRSARSSCCTDCAVSLQQTLRRSKRPRHRAHGVQGRLAGRVADDGSARR